MLTFGFIWQENCFRKWLDEYLKHTKKTSLNIRIERLKMALPEDTIKYITIYNIDRTLALSGKSKTYAALSPILI